LRIAISGQSGCGNTTATNNVGGALQLRVVNYTFRDLAKELNLGFDALHSHAEKTFIYDYLTDLVCIRAALSQSIIVGNRLAAWLVEADLRVWLHASLEARAARIARRESEKGSSYESVLYKTLQRDAQNRRRYLQVYGIDIQDHNDLDITINTEMLTADQVSSLIASAATWAKGNTLRRENVHLARIREIISENLKVPEKALFNSEENWDVKVLYDEFLARNNRIRP